MTGAMRAGERSPTTTGRRTSAAAVAAAAAPELPRRGRGRRALDGSIEPADDVTKTHALAFDTFRSLNSGSLGRVDGDRVVLERARGPRRHVTATSAAERVHLVTATVAMDGTPIDALRAAGADGFVVAATGAGNTAASLLAAAERAMADGLPVALTTRCPAGAASADYAFPGGGATWVRAGAMLAGHLGGPKARIALALGPRRGPGSRRPRRAARRSRRPRPWHARRDAARRPRHRSDRDARGRLRASAGSRRSGSADGRVAFAGSAVELETRADPHTVRFELDPDEVAIPGLTDAHLHLAEGGIARDQVDLSQVAVARRRPSPRSGAAGEARPEGERWIEGHGWDHDRCGRWPTADDLEAVAPGRLVALWAHDHHSLWVSRAALATAAIEPRHRRPRRRPHPSRRRRRAERRPPRDRRPGS